MVEFGDRERRFMERLINRTMIEGKLPGLVIALIDGERVIYSRGFGSRDLERNLPAGPDTLFGIASCTKSFTALSALQLVERGQIGLEDDVREILDLDMGREITLHQLLSMSSGMPNLGTGEVLMGRLLQIEERGIPLGSFEDLARYFEMAEGEMLAPGERFLYNNEGYKLLGELISRVAGVRYEEFVRRNILDPLGMRRSTFDRSLFERDHNAMVPYLVERTDKGVRHLRKPYIMHEMANGAGGLVSTPEDLIPYLRMYLDGGESDGCSLLRESLLDEMLHIQIGEENLALLGGISGPAGYGYGWSIDEGFLDHKIVFHSGSVPVLSSFMAFVPEAGVAGLVIANTHGKVDRVLLSGLALMMGDEPEDVIPSFSLEKALARLCGVYRSYGNIYRVEVTPRRGYLWLRSSGVVVSMDAPLIPKRVEGDQPRFYIPTGPGERMTVDFELTEDGRVEILMGNLRLHKAR